MTTNSFHRSSINYQINFDSTAFVLTLIKVIKYSCVDIITELNGRVIKRTRKSQEKNIDKNQTTNIDTSYKK